MLCCANNCCKLSPASLRIPKGDVFPLLGYLSPRVIRISMFLTLLFLWGWSGRNPQFSHSVTLLPCTLWSHYMSGSRGLSVLLQLCGAALSAGGPCSPECFFVVSGEFFLLSFSARAINFLSVHLTDWTRRQLQQLVQMQKLNAKVFSLSPSKCTVCRKHSVVNYLPDSTSWCFWRRNW